jgi:hypothetical protein
MLSFYQGFITFIILTSSAATNVIAQPTPANTMSDMQIRAQTAVTNFFLDITQLKGDLEQLLVLKSPSDVTTIVDLAQACQNTTIDADGHRQNLYDICGGKDTTQASKAAEQANNELYDATNPAHFSDDFSTYNFIMNNPMDPTVKDNVVSSIDNV